MARIIQVYRALTNNSAKIHIMVRREIIIYRKGSKKLMDFIVYCKGKTLLMVKVKIARMDNQTQRYGSLLLKDRSF